MTDEPNNTDLQNEGIFITDKDKPDNIVKRRWKIIQYIKGNPDSSAYGIAKGMRIGYATIHYALRELVFARIVHVKQTLDSQDRPIEVFSVPEGEGKNGD